MEQSTKNALLVAVFFVIVYCIYQVVRVENLKVDYTDIIYQYNMLPAETIEGRLRHTVGEGEIVVVEYTLNADDSTVISKADIIVAEVQFRQRLDLLKDSLFLNHAFEQQRDYAYD